MEQPQEANMDYDINPHHEAATLAAQDLDNMSTEEIMKEIDQWTKNIHLPNASRCRQELRNELARRG
jgi:hypothetical protein